MTEGGCDVVVNRKKRKMSVLCVRVLIVVVGKEERFNCGSGHNVLVNLDDDDVVNVICRSRAVENIYVPLTILLRSGALIVVVTIEIW